MNVSLLTFTSAVCFAAAVCAADPLPLLNSGVNSGGAVLAHGAREQHFVLVEPSTVVGLPFVFTSVGGFPVGPWLGDNAVSTWIVPNPDSNADPADYYYRFHLNLAGFDSSTVSISGSWSTDNAGQDILVNGIGTGNSNPTLQFTGMVPFTLSGNFVDGVNTIDFKVNNAGGSPNPAGFRVEWSGTADQIPPGLPPLVLTPPSDADVREGALVILTAGASGSYPISFQWSVDGTPIPGATDATLILDNVAVSQSGTYSVRASNPSGSDSVSATVTVRAAEVTVSTIPGLLVQGLLGHHITIESIDDLNQLPGWTTYTDINELPASPFLVTLPEFPEPSTRYFRAFEVTPP